MHSRELEIALKNYLDALSEANAAFSRYMLHGDSSEWLDKRADQDYRLVELVKLVKGWGR